MCLKARKFIAKCNDCETVKDFYYITRAMSSQEIQNEIQELEDRTSGDECSDCESTNIEVTTSFGKMPVMKFR